MTGVGPQHAAASASARTVGGAAIALYDGACGFCKRSVDFAATRAKPGRLQFITLQSDQGRRLQSQYGIDPSQLATMVLIESGSAHVRSTAALHMLRHMRQPWPMLSVLLLLPRFLRDWVYDWIARHRHLFSDACTLPGESDKKK